RPRGKLIFEGRERGGGVEGCYSPVEPQVLRLGREAPGGECGLERPVLAQDVGGLLRPDSRGAWEPVRGIAAQGDEVRHLLRLDAVALAHLGRADARQFGDSPYRLQDRRVLAGELESVAVGGRHESRAATALLDGDGSGEEVVRLVPGRLSVREPERGDELRELVELLDELRVELAPTLVGLERLVTVGRWPPRLRSSGPVRRGRRGRAARRRRPAAGRAEGAGRCRRSRPERAAPPTRGRSAQRRCARERRVFSAGLSDAGCPPGT